jgi:hypothetical protein
MIVGGVLVNRLNVFVVGYRPPSAKPTIPRHRRNPGHRGPYRGLMFLYRFLVTYLPVLNKPEQEVSA